MHSRKFVVSNTGTVNTLKKYSISDREILNKRIKTNPRYSGVRPRTNTGFNTQRRQELELEIRKYYKVNIFFTKIYILLACTKQNCLV